ncbi:unnamed protein product [Rotaria sp. Silwood1]|nr:unnamed protein product [Rotaria sp. Silwood1]CAF1586412.1 unnamed protein product [Rotaria sp. Silwood1]CAF3689149.1 unnamed protein product [Rotaria sp. Silwood1]CAF4853477.1 unnamed protein product [Rotaria sp. Silwood1]
MANKQIEEQLMSARSEILFSNHEKIDKKRTCHSPLKSPELIRTHSRRSARSAAPNCCACCKIPLLTDLNERESLNKSRASSPLRSERLCQECSQEKVENRRTPSSRLLRSASVNWSNMGGKIETWFEKAPTPDQKVVYNFLEKINNEENKQDQKSTEATNAKNLDDVLNCLKKYQTRFNSPRSRSKFTRAFESSSWRVMRHPTASYQFSRYNAAYGDEASRDLYLGSIFTPTSPRVRSTFLIHPSWV